VATWRDVRRIALALPEVTEKPSGTGLAFWLVKDKSFAWERPLRKSDLAALGEAAPKGAILGVRVQDLDMKDALLSEEPNIYFTTPHFNGYPAVLVRLNAISVGELRELLTDAWVNRAPKRLAKAFLAR
jgi:hypothetical protein